MVVGRKGAIKKVKEETTNEDETVKAKRGKMAGLTFYNVEYTRCNRMHCTDTAEKLCVLLKRTKTTF